MMKRLLGLVVVVGLVVPAFAADKIKDMSDKHWAAWAVYDLVNKGVTKGYPDGTFRGSKPITRYETAVFLAKLAQAIGAEDLKADLEAMKKDLAELKTQKSNVLVGDFRSTWNIGNVLAEAGSTRGLVASYRLKLQTKLDLSEKTGLTFNLDTMDYGFSNASNTGGILARQLLDIESNVDVDLAVLGVQSPVNLQLTYGPGPQTHTDSTGGVLASEQGRVYLRPYTGLMATTQLWGTELGLGYHALSQEAAGRVGTSRISGLIGYSFTDVPWLNKLDLQAIGMYVSSGMYSSSTRNTRAEVKFSAPLGEKVQASSTVGLGGSRSSTMMVKGEVGLNDLWQTGTVAKIKVAKLGSQYFDNNFSNEEANFAGLDSFDRALTPGSVNFGGEVVQEVADDVRLVGKGDLRLSSNYVYSSDKGRLTAQGGVSYDVAPNATMDAFYRLQQDRAAGDTSDVLGAGLMYNF